MRLSVQWITLSCGKMGQEVCQSQCGIVLAPSM
ncbi:hypothetical protein ABIC03_004253 [Bradyrhizobium sp. RT6a]